MRALGIQGVTKGKVCRTTFSKKGTWYPEDKVKRQFLAERLNALWVVDAQTTLVADQIAVVS